MIFVIKIKKYIAGISIFDIIKNKLYYKNKPYLIILFKIDKVQK